MLSSQYIPKEIPVTTPPEFDPIMDPEEPAYPDEEPAEPEKEPVKEPGIPDEPRPAEIPLPKDQSTTNQ